MANNFEFYAPTRVIFGKGTEGRVGALAKEYGAKNILIVYGGKSAVRSGLLELVKKALEEEGLRHLELGGVVPNPRLDKVYEGIALGKREKVDFLLAVGGGSAIDTAKAIAYGLAEPEKDVWDLFAHTRTAQNCLPVASILTIAAAGSETSKGCVITNERTGEKRAYDDNLARPRFAVMNPEYTKTLPDYQTESGCVDIMMHTMERYFTGGGDFMSHKLEHEMGGMFNVTHGAGLAAVWPSWARHVYKNALPRFVRYARNVLGVAAEGSDEEIALLGIQEMESFYHSVGMPVNFSELGIRPTDAQIEEMAQRCLAACGGHTGSAKRLSPEDMIAVYKAARDGSV